MSFSVGTRVRPIGACTSLQEGIVQEGEIWHEAWPSKRYVYVYYPGFNKYVWSPVNGLEAI